MNRKREIINRIEKQLRDIYGTVASIEGYLGELECIINYENNHNLDGIIISERNEHE